MLNSYKTIIGIATIVWENTSGVGEITAPTTKDSTKTCFRFAVKKADPINPTLANTKIKRGNSKIKPKGDKKEITKDKYCPIESKGCSSGVANPMKNLIPAGNTRTYANASPTKNSSTEDGTNIREAQRSFFVKAGTTKAHT